MQRPIKFRAWDKEKKEMHLVGAITFNASGKFNPKDLVIDDEEWLQIEKYELMQFTGLLDKNGKEIYEGDIVELTMSNPPNHTFIQTITWDDIYLQWTLLIPGTDGGNYPIALVMDNLVEVIGNIFENPELINQ
jgi:uncharacterized phage protein (TIGR01671 family)